MMTRVDKPALLRNLFELECSYSGQIVSLNKMLGQLHDAGSVTLALPESSCRGRDEHRAAEVLDEENSGEGIEPETAGLEYLR